MTSISYCCPCCTLDRQARPIYLPGIAGRDKWLKALCLYQYKGFKVFRLPFFFPGTVQRSSQNNLMTNFSPQREFWVKKDFTLESTKLFVCTQLCEHWSTLSKLAIFAQPLSFQFTPKCTRNKLIGVNGFSASVHAIFFSSSSLYAFCSIAIHGIKGFYCKAIHQVDEGLPTHRPIHLLIQPVFIRTN